MSLCGWCCCWCCCCSDKTDDHHTGPATRLITGQPKRHLDKQDSYLDLPNPDPSPPRPSIEDLPEEKDQRKYYVQWPFGNLIKGMEVEEVDSDNKNEEMWINVRDADGNITRAPINYLTKIRDIKDEPWYFFNIENRDHAELVLKNSQDGDGIYLIRKCSNNSSPYVLSIKQTDPNSEDGLRVDHYQIYQKNGFFGQEGEENFVTLSAMMDHYIATGLLSQPCIKEQIIDILPSELRKGQELGRGEFGVVYEGIWRERTVAVKEILKEDALVAEIKLICQFNHPHIVTMYGANVSTMPHFMVMEFMCNGPLNSYLPQHALTFEEKLFILEQVSDGMRFLEKYKVIHRDLAARNILVGNELCVKIADFGLSRNLKKNSVYYVMTDLKLPLLWLALESLEKHVFTVKSDVWMFGVLAMEVFNDGQKPYYDLLAKGYTVIDICHLVASGTRMHRPISMTPDVYDKILDCWETRPEKRPSFNDLYMFFMNFKEQ